jgi:uncharacterized protein
MKIKLKIRKHTNCQSLLNNHNCNHTMMKNKIRLKLKNPFRLIKHTFRIKDEPKVIAKGFALGSFIGMLPIPGFQVMVSLAIASLLKVNKKAACLAVFNTNLATGAFVFSFNYWLGKQILGVNPSFIIGDRINIRFISLILKAGTDVFLSLVVGGVLTGIVSAAIVYLMFMKLYGVKLGRKTLI